jgi:hypothetical protein
MAKKPDGMLLLGLLDDNGMICYHEMRRCGFLVTSLGDRQ